MNSKNSGLSFREWLAQIDRAYFAETGFLLLAEVPFSQLNRMYENNYNTGEALAALEKK